MPSPVRQNTRRRPTGPTRVRDVRLVQPSDPGYRAYMDRILAEAFTLREKQATRASQLVARIAENAVRVWLASRAPVTSRRILAYQAQSGDFGYRDYYRELDVVAWPDGAPGPSAIYEIKCSRQPSILRTATGQLRKTLDLAGRRWSGVTGVAVLVDFSRGDFDIGLEDTVSTEPGAGPAVVLPPGRAGRSVVWNRTGAEARPEPYVTQAPGVVYCLVDRLWVRGVAEEAGLLTDPDLWARAEAEEETGNLAGEGSPAAKAGSETPPGQSSDKAGQSKDRTYRTYVAGGNDPAESPLAAALRRAGLAPRKDGPG